MRLHAFHQQFVEYIHPRVSQLSQTTDLSATCSAIDSTPGLNVGQSNPCTLSCSYWHAAFSHSMPGPSHPSPFNELFIQRCGLLGLSLRVPLDSGSSDVRRATFRGKSEGSRRATAARSPAEGAVAPTMSLLHGRTTSN